jgi:hypothetical protein
MVLPDPRRIPLPTMDKDLTDPPLVLEKRGSTQTHKGDQKKNRRTKSPKKIRRYRMISFLKIAAVARLRLAKPLPHSPSKARKSSTFVVPLL